MFAFKNHASSFAIAYKGMLHRQELSNWWAACDETVGSM
jgi:hypothetical protein